MILGSAHKPGMKSRILVILLSFLAGLSLLFARFLSPVTNSTGWSPQRFQLLLPNPAQGQMTSALPTLRFSPASGPLRVSPANPRYFIDASGKAVFLTGSHTWDNRQDQGRVNFNWSVYLDDLESWNHNFIRLWVWEQARNLTTWPDPVSPDTTLTPKIWLRTGPGSAADGGLKFDLTQYNSAHFIRLRQRIIEAGTRGMYVSIMLFDGWSMAQKSGGSNPWTYHPFRSANNINGIDGDPNKDHAGYEIQNLSNAQITALQEAYVAHVIDSVNDLENVLYEISNESSGDIQGTLAWTNHFINYIHVYEASKPRQHPVWFTVLYPGGNNQDLFASAAEAIAPNSDVPGDGAKVVIADTDHYFGIGGDADWAWKEFTRGCGGVAYMDSWENLFLDASSFGHPIQNFRANLGYILSYANRLNLVSMTPREDLCSTGYCLANPAASGAEYLVYLPAGSTAEAILETLGTNAEEHSRLSSVYLPTDSSVTVDLSATPGTLAVEWFNPQTGVVITSRPISGGANRLLIAPFAGEAVLYLYQPEVTISNVAAWTLDTLARITWNTDVPATGRVEFGTSPSLGMQALEQSAPVTAHFILLTNLVPKTTYDYKVISTVPGGQAVESQGSSFSTLAREDIWRRYLPVIFKSFLGNLTGS